MWVRNFEKSEKYEIAKNLNECIVKTLINFNVSTKLSIIRYTLHTCGAKLPSKYKFLRNYTAIMIKINFSYNFQLITNISIIYTKDS